MSYRIVQELLSYCTSDTIQLKDVYQTIITLYREESDGGCVYAHDRCKLSKKQGTAQKTRVMSHQTLHRLIDSMSDPESLGTMRLTRTQQKKLHQRGELDEFNQNFAENCKRALLAEISRHIFGTKSSLRRLNLMTRDMRVEFKQKYCCVW